MAYRVLVTDDVDPEGLALLTAEPELLASGFTVCAMVSHEEIEVLAP